MTPFPKTKWLRWLLLICLVRPCPAGDVVADSGQRRVALIELYSSEGCSSCPPADRWLGKLVQADGLWRDFVPVEFHVDYWDGLGWKDVYALPIFTQRQRAYAVEWGATNVYTPEFVLNGKEWRSSWAQRDVPLEDDKSPGRLQVERISATEFRVVFHPAAAFAGGEALLVPLGFDRVSDVARGENAGSRLAHQFVALALYNVTLTTTGTSGDWTGTVSVPAETFGEKRIGLAAWVSAKGSSVPLQAAGGWLTK